MKLFEQLAQDVKTSSSEWLLLFKNVSQMAFTSIDSLSIPKPQSRKTGQVKLKVNLVRQTSDHRQSCVCDKTIFLASFCRSYRLRKKNLTKSIRSLVTELVTRVTQMIPSSERLLTKVLDSKS